MNIVWDWVHALQKELRESGERRAAELIDALPNAVVHEDKVAVELLTPELLAFARSTDNAWLEIFARHWYLQGQGGGLKALPEAVSLLEFSHRPEHRECPQSVCAVQDVAIAYKNVDDVGYVEERLAVSGETMERIDPTRWCFTCIATEHAEALLDAGRFEEAYTFVEAQYRRWLDARPGRDDLGWSIHLADALIGMGRPEEALERLDLGLARSEKDVDHTSRRSAQNSRTRALLALGRFAEARESLLDVDVALGDAGHHCPWAEAVAALAAAGHHDVDGHTGRTLATMLEEQLARGRASDGVRVAQVQIALALQRGAVASARQGLAALGLAAAKLRDPARAEPVVATLTRMVGDARAARGVAAGETPEAALAAAAGEADRELALDRLEVALEAWPDHHELTMAYCDTLAAVGWARPAADVLEPYAGRLAAGTGDPDRAAAALMQLAERALRPEEQRRLAEKAAELAPSSADPPRLLAQLAEGDGRFLEALEHRTTVVGLVAADAVREEHLARTLPASVLGFWRVARESARAAGWDVELNDDPIDRPGETVQIRLHDGSLVTAQRIGPATARVTELAWPSGTQHAKDVLAFAPGAQADATWFDVRATISNGGMRSTYFDGAFPGDAAWAAFERALDDAGWMIRISHKNGYVVDLSDLDASDDESVPGVYGVFGIPDAVTDREAHRRLTELTATWPRVFTWKYLAKRADEAAGREQARVSELAGLY